jgi:hypothetical protein
MTARTHRGRIGRRRRTLAGRAPGSMTITKTASSAATAETTRAAV